MDTILIDGKTLNLQNLVKVARESYPVALTDAAIKSIKDASILMELADRAVPLAHGTIASQLEEECCAEQAIKKGTGASAEEYAQRVFEDKFLEKVFLNTTNGTVAYIVASKMSDQLYFFRFFRLFFRQKQYAF